MARRFCATTAWPRPQVKLPGARPFQAFSIASAIRSAGKSAILVYLHDSRLGNIVDAGAR